MRACAERDCGRRHYAGGYCRLHWRRFKSHSDTGARKPGKPYTGRTEAQLDAVLNARRVRTPRGCLEWVGPVGGHGYPLIGWKGTRWLVHRLVYTRAIGPIPRGLWVLHRCDNQRCSEPTHLFLGTAADNNADMDAKGRANRVGFREVLRGERHPGSRLTDAEADAIRASDERGVDLAARYGVAQQTICNIRKGRRRQAL